MKPMSWPLRLAVVLSVLWLVFVFALSEEGNRVSAFFLVVGVIPVVGFWGISWILQGVRSRRVPDSTEAASAETLARRRSAWRNFFIGLGLAVLGGVIAAYFAQDYTDYPSALMGRSIGEWSVYALLAALASTVLLRVVSSAPMLAFGGTFLFLGIWNGLQWHSEVSDAKQFAVAFPALLQRINRGDEVTGEEVRSMSVGSAEPAIMAFVDYSAAMNAAMRQFAQSVAAADVEQILSPALLATQSGSKLAMSNLSLVSRAVDALEHQFALAVEVGEDRVRRLKRSNGLTAGFVKGLSKKFEIDRDLHNEFIAIQRQVITTSSEIVRLIDSNRRRIVFLKTDLSFNDQATLQTYQSMRRRLSATIAAESDLRARTLATQREGLNAIRQAVERN